MEYQLTRRKWLKLTGLLLIAPKVHTMPIPKDKIMNNIDVFILGGGPAGLSAALTLGRGGRSVIVCDDARPRNKPAAHMNNYPSHDGLPPSEFRELVKKDLKKYKTVKLIQESAKDIKRVGEIFSIELADGTMINARKILLAHGVSDGLPDKPGFKELWGKGVFHCPYCHGFEHKGEKLGLVMNGTVAIHMTPILLGLTSDLMIFTDGPHDFTDENIEVLKRNNVIVHERKIKALIHEGEKLKAIEFEDHKHIERDGLFYKPDLTMKSDLGIKLGCKLNSMGFYEIDNMNRTTEKGVYAAGDIGDMRHSVLMASASGQFSGAALNHEILNEDFLKK